MMESEATLPEGFPGAHAHSRGLLVAIPALDEETTVGEIVRGVPRTIPGVDSVAVVVVDDGSTDGTSRRAAEEGAHVIRHPKTRGVGAAFQSALTYGIEQGADLIVSIDADGQFSPADIPALVEPVVSEEADFATASRFKDPALVPEMPRMKLWGNRMMSRLISRLTGEVFYDVSCGMRCYNRRAALQLHLLGRFTYTQEVFLNLAFKQLRIAEVPIRVRGERQYGTSRVAASLWGYGLRTAQIIFRCYRDYHPLRFFGGIALAMILPGVALGLFLLAHYFRVGSFSPYKWTGFAAAGLVVLSMVMVHIGIIGDMLNRHRVYLEELLYRERVRTGRDRDN
jgi:glycosyltransferase involved in cell wall biosynthesis